MDASGHILENCWPLKYNIQNLIDVGFIHVDSSGSQDIHKNPYNAAWPSINIVVCDKFEFDTSQLII